MLPAPSSTPMVKRSTLPVNGVPRPLPTLKSTWPPKAGFTTAFGNNVRNFDQLHGADWTHGEPAAFDAHHLPCSVSHRLHPAGGSPTV